MIINNNSNDNTISGIFSNLVKDCENNINKFNDNGKSIKNEISEKC